MIAYAMVYAALVGLPILLAAIACSAALRRYGRPERGAWLVALGLALVLPGAFLLNPFGLGSSGIAGTLPEAESPAVASGALPVVGSPASAPGMLPETGPPAFASEKLSGIDPPTLLSEIEPPALPSGTLTETGVLGLPNVVTVPAEQSALGLNEIVVLAWLLASVILTLRWAVGVYRLARAGRSWSADTVDGVRVWLTSNLGPAVSGVLRTRILVPSWVVSLPEEQRSLVLLHEEEHVRAKDPVLLAFSRIALIVAPWNPVVWRLSSRLLHAVEMDCDRRVLRRRPNIATYGDTLLTVSARDPSPLVAAAAFAESEVPLRKRIVAMTTPPRSASTLGVLTALALGVVLLIGSCEVPVPIALGPDTQDNIVRISMEEDGSVRVNDEPYPMGAVSTVVAAHYAASESTPVTSLRMDPRVPYQFMDQLQGELVAAGVVRVVYEELDTPSLQSSPENVSSLVERGVAMVLGAARAAYEALVSLAVRSPALDAPGTVAPGLATVESLISRERFAMERLTQMARELQQVENSLNAFLFENRDFSTSPQLQFEHDRLLRELTMRQEVLTSLTQALKESRDERIRSMPVVPQQGQGLQLNGTRAGYPAVRVPALGPTSPSLRQMEEPRFRPPGVFLRNRPAPEISTECREVMVRKGWVQTSRGGFVYTANSPAISTGDLAQVRAICKL